MGISPALFIELGNISNLQLAHIYGRDIYRGVAHDQDQAPAPVRVRGPGIDRVRKHVYDQVRISNFRRFDGNGQDIRHGLGHEADQAIGLDHVRAQILVCAQEHYLGHCRTFLGQMREILHVPDLDQVHGLVLAPELDHVYGPEFEIDNAHGIVRCQALVQGIVQVLGDEGVVDFE